MRHSWSIFFEIFLILRSNMDRIRTVFLNYFNDTNFKLKLFFVNQFSMQLCRPVLRILN